ncbi:MAG: M67 family metallopeptidase [Deltaproteobacteria bacterium]|nr:M67 family metallopeptidase [Deltaproteobacteria bacterium]
MLQINKKLLDEIFAECKRAWPEEACGMVVGEVGSHLVATQVIPSRNLQNELHRSDPKRYPRDAKTAYVIDPKEIERIAQEARDRGEAIVSMFHSHPEHGVYFSKEDREMAAPWGEPLFPHMSYIVVSVIAKEVKGASEFYWDLDKKDYVERKIL